ncbi:MAG: type IV pilus assembly protein PilM [Candidatus Vogelbacteria bacterium]|nr:type IV pilus assembly protein PilM [Candidatus Vogelbacteria bacterium]
MANFLSRSLGRLFDLKRLGLFKQEDNSVVGIDIGSSSIKAVQIRKEAGRPVLETYGELATGPYKGVQVGQAAILTVDKLVEALGDLFRAANITTKNVAMAIPLRGSLLTIIELPKVGEAKINEMVPLEARKYIPVPMSEVTMDWFVIPKREASLGDTPGTFEEPNYGRKPIDTIEVLIVAIHNSIIEQYQSIISKMGFVAKPYEIETFSSIRSVFGRDMTAMAVVDMGASSTRVSIVDYGVTRVSHTINKGSQDITSALAQSLGLDFAKAEEIKRRLGAVGRVNGGEMGTIVTPSLDYILFEARRIILAYEKKYSRSVSRVVLIGGGALLKGFQETASKSLDSEVVLGNPFSKLETPAFLEPMLRDAGPSFSVAIGVALRDITL